MSTYYSTLSLFAFLFGVAVESKFAQSLPAQVDVARLQFADDVKQAGVKAKVEVGDNLITGFANSAMGQGDAFARIYGTVPKGTRVTRLAQYLAAKADAKSSVGPLHAGLTAGDLGDFHWGYLGRDMKYSPARFEGVKGAKLYTVESSGEQYNFGEKGQMLDVGGTVVLPGLVDVRNSPVTLTFAIGSNSSSWTGSVDAGLFTVATASTSRGCEIYVNSKPPKANVYFNGREWNRTTNTKSVREPGTWDVVIRLPDHKEWRDQRKLGPGDTWVIDAVLAKQ